ncbi:MAG: putative chorismate mutase [Variovorax sp.]|nr:putative chorismate mutase [Variovorax sp.]
MQCLSGAIAHRAVITLAFSSLVLCCAEGFAQIPSSQDFSKLVELSATRLHISRRVALTKWDTHQPVADPPQDPRENQVIAAAAEEAARSGLPAGLASAFFADQIEASKLVQFELMAEWQRAARAPLEPRADLKTELRPALDALRSRFIGELIATQRLRSAPDCRRQVAHATRAHAEMHRLGPLYAIALDRGLARVCGE